MLKEIKALLQDAQLRQEIQEAKTADDVIKLLTTTGTQKGYNFKLEDVNQMLTGFALKQLDELSEEDLQAVAGYAPRREPRCAWPPYITWWI